MLKLVLVLCVVSATWAAEEAGAEGTAIEKMRLQYLSRGVTEIKSLGR